MNRYEEMKNRQQKEYNDFSKNYCFYAFSNKQFAEGMQRFHLDPETDLDKIAAIGAGGFVLKDQAAALRSLFDSFTDEREAAIAADKTGDGFIYEMFVSELENHEFSYTEDPEDAINACGLSASEVIENAALNNGLVKAMQTCRENARE